eukprot:3936439-Rhodomonas_salina.6
MLRTIGGMLPRSQPALPAQTPAPSQSRRGPRRVRLLLPAAAAGGAQEAEPGAAAGDDRRDADAAEVEHAEPRPGEEGAVRL